jgi:16S rRNA (cytidine1402-2'-O)-methyltransferase
LDTLGRLILVPTPIGNLGDLTHRAETVLREADVIACEDTRHSSRLLQHYEITTSKISLHEHNEAMRSDALILEMKAGKTVALISDAGAPTISDPGQRFLQRCLAAGIPYDVLPGPSAVITALSGSGLPTDTFYYGGFLPNKSGQRQRILETALAREETCVFFESPHRIVRSLDVLANADPERWVCVARELTKRHQEFRRERAPALHAHYSAHPPKGEITLVIGPSKLPKWFVSSFDDDDDS